MSTYVRVLLDESGGRAFDYGVPEGVRIGVGWRVRVPVRTRLILGTVIAMSDVTEAQSVRMLGEVVGDEPALGESLIRLAQWMSDYYCCPLESAVRSILPNVIRKAEAGHKVRLFARLAREVAEEELAAMDRRAPRQADVVRALQQLDAAKEPATENRILNTENSSPAKPPPDSRPRSLPVAELGERCGVAHQTIQAMAKKGLLIVEAEKVERDPFAKEQFVSSPALAMNPEQLVAFQRVCDEVNAVARGMAKEAPAQGADTPHTAATTGGERAAPRPFLLHGVTGSGKTEIYLQAIDRALEHGMGAILLVPEISLTPQTVERFRSRFAATHHEVAVLHSHLSEGERHDEWHRIRSGRARIVIGARSAVFAPVDRLGIIIVDEEHENSYKQEEMPRYHGRDLAVLRGHLEKCVVVLGSATPSLESAYNAASGKYEKIRLTMRVDDQKMPFIRIVDMRLEAAKSSPILSDPLRNAMQLRLEKKEQVILFLNRRGFSTTLLCNKCGFVAECPNCSVALTFHRAASRIVCHICGHMAVAPSKCPDCKDPGIKYTGTGTEKVEDSVQKCFPSAVVKRMDADVMQRREAYRETLGAFRSGKIDVLVGTQMIAKGLHFPNVTLVGIVNADMGLHIPDFRASERTFQLLTQVAGRAGRGDVSGEVVVQSYTPFHPAIQFARHHDFDGFYEQEIEWREKMIQPPFTHFVLITIRCPHEERAKLSAETLHRRLKEAIPPGVTLGDPAPAPLEKSHGNFRWHVSLRSRAVLKLSRALRAVLDRLTWPEDVFVVVDVDAHHLL